MTAAELRALAAAMTKPPYRYNVSTGRIEGRGINAFLPKDVCEMFVGNLAGNAAGLLAFLQHRDTLVALLEACERRRDAVCWSTGGQGDPMPRRTVIELCMCGTKEDFAGCPITAADRAIDAALTAVHAVATP